MSNNEAHYLLLDYGISIGVNDLKFNSLNECVLSFGEVQILLIYAETKEAIILSTRVSDTNRFLNIENLKKLLEYSTASSYFGKGHIGVDSEKDEIIYIDKKDLYGLTLVKMQEWLQKTFKDISFWQETVARIAGESVGQIKEELLVEQYMIRV